MEKERMSEESLDPVEDNSVLETEASSPGSETKTKRFGLHKKQKEKKPGGKKFTRKRILIILLIVLVVVAAAFGLRSCGNEMTLPVSTAEAQKMDIQEVVTIKGTVEGSDSADVVSPLNYTIKNINVSEGDRVKTGQILAVLDGKELQTAYDLALSQYKQSQFSLQETLRTQQNEYDNAVRALNESKLSYDAYKKLFEDGGVSQVEYLKYESDYLAKQAAVNSFNISGGKVIATAAQNQSLEVQRLAAEEKRKALDELNIKSPIDGTVTRVNATIGRLANENGSNGQNGMFVIEDIDNLQMNVTVSEYDINKLALGQSVTISSDVMGTDTVTGVVSQISPSGEEKNNNGTVSMVIPVRIDITEKNEKLIAGVTAKAVILVNEAKDVLSIPLDALLEDVATGESYVLVPNAQNVLEKRVVETGLEGDFYIQITGGDLLEGEAVVMNAGASMLTEGMTVVVQ